MVTAGCLSGYCVLRGRSITSAVQCQPDLKFSPMEYTEQGRVFCSVDLFEGVEMTKAVADILGDHVLMYESDYPHPETIYPDHTDMAIAWEEHPRQEGAGQDDVGERGPLSEAHHIAVVVER